MKKAYITPLTESNGINFAEGLLQTISKGYIQNPDGSSTGETITIGENEEEGGAKRFDFDWDLEGPSSDWDLNE